MTIGCYCGATIYDQAAESYPDKAHLIPDEAWPQIWNKIETEFLGKVANGRVDENAAYRELSLMFHRPRRYVHQCSACGRLYVDAPDGSLQCYVPADSTTSRDVLRRSEHEA